MPESDFGGYIDPLHLQIYRDILAVVKKARAELVNQGVSKKEARRRFGGTIHHCESVIAEFRQWQKNCRG